MSTSLVRAAPWWRGVARRLIGSLKSGPAGATAISPSHGGWVSLIRERYAGAWQRNQEFTADTIAAHHAVYACVTLIAADVGKLRPKLVELTRDGIWQETSSPAFSPVLRRPNGYQNHIQFKEWWITSKLLRGNTYVLLERDRRGVVIAMYVLEPSRVRPLVTPNGEVYYELRSDNLSGLQLETTIVPASEIINDRMNCLFHPLVGTSPIYACGAAADIGLRIQETSSNFFGQGANPSGILTAPDTITKEKAEQLSDQWKRNFTGDNAGRVAVLGNNLKFEPLRMSAVDAQTIEHLKWSAEMVCSTFHVPPFKIGIGQLPTFNNSETLNGIYYADCLQSHIEAMEEALDVGLGLHELKDGTRYGVELDLDGLLRMDSATQMKTLGEGVQRGIVAPNEARQKLDLAPVAGGDSPMMQQQQFSLAAIAKRDAREDPFARVPPSPPEDATKASAIQLLKRIAVAVRLGDEVAYDGERRLTIAGKVFTLPIPIHRGTWKRGQAYEPGDLVTDRGSMWKALVATTEGRPAQCNDWQLVVRNGRDARHEKGNAEGGAQ